MASRIRLSPAQRREQLLDLGVRLFARRSLDELSVDAMAQEAGISRGLLYHYFGDKLGFREAVVRRAAADLLAKTAPPSTGEPLERLLCSMTAYLDWVEENHEGYLSLVRGAASDPTLREVYDEARAALTDRIFVEDETGLLPDTAAARLLVRAWAAFAEELVLSWVADPGGVGREQVVQLLAGSLPALVGVTP
ncbi:TetR/AcrR family transcriptional regulator [Nocardioides sp. BP30]|uniref:TetR/AcrR family transcriptional regulator n=1 Tax=Nocardioides sp. BP30 TaxID=3036374 RepID=UPI002468AF30|nr:TetR/AcrR family transcriptional regulator [Nocardioides sp. BP30]WGL51806.1 TetR/AcrR family transcriptional regulator [Nocardioides sp. BP30]